MTDGITLTDKQREDLLKVLGCFAPVVERVDVYGSRARGDAHPGSDVDLILAGDIDLYTLTRIAQALDDSYLSIYADVNAYALLKGDAFAKAVTETAKTLFTAADLAAAPQFQPVDGLREWYQPLAA